MRLTTAAVLLFATAGVAADQRQPAPPPNPLQSIPGYTCSFGSHAATAWGKAGPATVLGEEAFTFQIAAVNVKLGRARIVGAGGGSAEVTAMLSPTGLNVIEQTGIGNFIMTTVFAAGGENRTFLAVHSRHLGDLQATPIVSQYFGTCEAASK